MNTVIKHHFEITVHPTDETPTTAVVQQASSKVKKWRFPWRINMLATPRMKGSKYQPPPAETHTAFPPLDRATEYRCTHLSTPLIRTVQENHITYDHYYDADHVLAISKTLQKCWNSIYNYYRKQLRNRELKRLQRKRKLEEHKKPKGKDLEKIKNEREEHLNMIATPKKLFPPEEIPRKRKPLEELAPYVDRLAMPKEYVILPPKKVGVNPAALKYEITETIMKLYQIPDRLKRSVDGPDPWVVSLAAKRYKCTPRIEKLAQPSFSAREAKKHDEDKYDPWVIPKSTQTYKPTARILELAKPLERE